MTWDYFTYLSQRDDIEATPLPWGYVSGWIDHPSTKVFALEIERVLAEEQGDKDRAKDLRDQLVEIQKSYRRRAAKLIPVRCFPFAIIDFGSLPSPHWLGLQVDFELLTPWYSRDDRLFHVMDNPVRKDRVFGVPFMAASSWKGMLRWAFRMVTGLIGPEQEVDENKREKAKDIELHLFGNEKGEEKDFRQGTLVFYPTWFNKIGFEVINPHRRATRAGTQPIYYEVVPPGAKGTLSLLYAPWPGMKHDPSPKQVLPRLLEAIETLLTTYGISAKRTVGWGTAKILEWRAYRKSELYATLEEWEKLNEQEKEELDKKFWRFFWDRKIATWFSEGGTT